jgi:hypothetical protein
MKKSTAYGYGIAIVQCHDIAPNANWVGIRHLEPLKHVLLACMFE